MFRFVEYTQMRPGLGQSGKSPEITENLNKFLVSDALRAEALRSS